MIQRIFSTAYHNAENSITPSTKLDYKVIYITVLTAFSLSMIKYWGDYLFLVSCLQSWGLKSLAATTFYWFTSPVNGQLHRLLYWVMLVIFFHLVPAFALIKWVFKQPFSNYGLSLKGAFTDYKVYLIMLAIMIPLVFYFSKTSSFQQRYPFYKLHSGEGIFPNLIIWEAFYFIQFFALEFFFRGFLLHGTKHKFGYYSVFVMTIPYCMIHFTKPFPETISAIIAGIVLGTLSLKSNSIWLGVAIHCSVAATMDVCSLYQQGLL
jgi:membrane protease YdiL (CAAX protease family)